MNLVQCLYMENSVFPGGCFWSSKGWGCYG